MSPAANTAKRYKESPLAKIEEDNRKSVNKVLNPESPRLQT